MSSTCFETDGSSSGTHILPPTRLLIPLTFKT